jgi:hypothetical protein
LAKQHIEVETAGVWKPTVVGDKFEGILKSRKMLPGTNSKDYTPPSEAVNDTGDRGCWHNLQVRASGIFRDFLRSALAILVLEGVWSLKTSCSVRTTYPSRSRIEASPIAARASVTALSMCVIGVWMERVY